MILAYHPLAYLLTIQIFADHDAPERLLHHDKCGVQQDVLGGGHFCRKGVSSQCGPHDASSGAYSAKLILLFFLLHGTYPLDDLPCHGACRFPDSISCTELCSPKVSY